MSPLPSYIFGMHDPGAETYYLNAGKPGWITIAVKVNPADTNGDFRSFTSAGFAPIIRLNNGYGHEGTLPPASQYDTFAQQCASFVANSRGASIWIIGNEPNLAVERPGNSGANDGEIITPDHYAQCFAKCRVAIKKISGHANDWVIPAAVGPWNNQTTYATNPNGDWVQYFQDVLNNCVQLAATPDAIALHSYTHGYDVNYITSEQVMSPPFQNRHYQFRAYRDFLAAVPTALRSLPVLLSEMQAIDWQDRSIGWIQAAYAEINGWNSVSTNQPIQAACLFRWQSLASDPPGWSISDKRALVDDFRSVLAANYLVRWSAPAPAPDPAAAAAITAAKKLNWMPINSDAALFRYAQSNNLGFPQTDEFSFTYGSNSYVGQVFNQGIVYAKKGDWGSIKWVPKP